jgi:hypothetical protein
MIHCRPKTKTYLALGLIVVILISGLLYILKHFTNQRSFGIAFYLIASVLLTLVILLLLVKMMASYKFISIGKEKITIKLPLRGKRISYRLDQVMLWDEEKVISNKREFKQITLVFEDKDSFTMTNHEHVNYDEFTGYLSKKIPKKNLNKIKKP